MRDRETLGALFTRLCEQVAADLQRKGYVGRTIGVKLRYDNFKIVTRDQSIEHYTADPKVLRQVAGQCLKRVDLSRKLRLLGVRVGTLLRAGDVGVAAATGSGLSLVAAEASPGLKWGHEQTDLLFPED